MSTCSYLYKNMFLSQVGDELFSSLHRLSLYSRCGTILPVGLSPFPFINMINKELNGVCGILSPSFPTKFSSYCFHYWKMFFVFYLLRIRKERCPFTIWLFTLNHVSPNPNTFCTWVHCGSDLETFFSIQYYFIQKETFSCSVHSNNAHYTDWLGNSFKKI